MPNLAIVAACYPKAIKSLAMIIDVSFLALFAENEKMCRFMTS